MSSELSERDLIIDKINHTVGRDLSEHMANYHLAIAERLGLNTSDHKALDLICTGDSLTAGQLARVTHLTTGAVTGLIDRLEQAGFVSRVRDPDDRRRVIIKPSTEVQSLATISDSLAIALAEICSHYTEQELMTILNFMTSITAAFQEEKNKLRM